jgi:NhaA family Na+:H+ antiporter
MAIFFLLVGLELRREMTRGELASFDRVAAPALAALGGMIVPAMVFSAFNYHDRFVMRGWAVPVATDIAFALAVLSVLGDRVPISLKVFLTALAIIDDLGAIVVIALFYTTNLDLVALGLASVELAGLWMLSRLGVRGLWVYLAGGVVLWVLVFESGVHSTLSGVALAFVIPMERRETEHAAPALRLEHALDRWVAYGILPLFGLTNAGLRFDALPPGAWRDTLAIGTALGLLLGKQIGVFGTVMAAARLRLVRLPAKVTTAQLYGGAVLCGIGFTMSLFIGDLAFRQTPRGDEVKLAVFIGSLSSAVLGLAILAIVSPRKLSGKVG